jgi:hypothetical protein
MSVRVPLFVGSTGIRHDWLDNEDGTYTVLSEYDAEPILDRNKALANHNDGYSPSREMRRVASIPLILWLKWLQDEGWDAFAPECADRLRRKLNSSEYMWLRTAPGKL